MKIAIVKDFKDKDIWGSAPIVWTQGMKPLDVLATFQSRCQAWGLLRDYADLLIINVPVQWYEARARKHEAELKWDKGKTLWPEIMLDNAGFYRKHAEARATDPVDAEVNHALAGTFPAEGEIDWGKYDVVICTSPWLSPEITRRFPKTVFAYWNYSATWEYFVSQQRGAPVDGHYDLHLDHIEGPDFVKHLPQTVYFPYATNAAVHEDFADVKKRGIATCQRTLDENPEIRQAWEAFNCNGLRIMQPPGKYGVGRLNGRDYFAMLAGAKYLVHVRNLWSGSGQKAVEAASLGTVVIGHQYGKAFDRIVHPFCKIETPYLFPARERGPFGPDGCPWEEVRKRIREQEINGALRYDVLNYQASMLDKEYERCIDNLVRAVELKRGA